MRVFVRGDIDGLAGLALDNLVQLLVIAALCRGVLGFDDALVAGHILPGAALSVLVGNLYYAWQAHQLARETGRDDVCALPYGINTPSVFAFVFLVMLPAKLAATAAGVADPARVAWQAGLAACFGSGLIELAGAFLAGPIRRLAPRAALLSTLAGVALTFIALGFLFRAFAHPLVGLTTLAIILVTYYGRVRFRGGLPGGLVAVVVGIAIAWATGLAPVGASPSGTGVHWPLPVASDLWAAVSAGVLLTSFSVILPMGLFNVVGSMQNLESAEAAGDRYPTLSSLAVNGGGTMLAALFGSCFPTTLYIGHPGWKAMGARAGYSAANGIFIALIGIGGLIGWIAWAVPIEAGMAIVLWIGIVIAAQAFDATPRAHAPAVVVGLLPGIAGWSAFMAKAGLLAGGATFGPALLSTFMGGGVAIDGAFRLEQGFILSAMLLSAMTVEIIERRFVRGAAWCFAGAALSACGLLHAYRFTPTDTVFALEPAWPWAAAWAAMGLTLLAARVVTTPVDGDAARHS